jgi:hypothetical protein
MLPVPAFQRLRETWRTIDAAAVYLHTVDWYRGIKAHHTTVVGCRHGKTPGILDSSSARCSAS